MTEDHDELDPARAGAQAGWIIDGEPMRDWRELRRMRLQGIVIEEKPMASPAPDAGLILDAETIPPNNAGGLSDPIVRMTSRLKPQSPMHEWEPVPLLAPPGRSRRRLGLLRTIAGLPLRPFRRRNTHAGAPMPNLTHEANPDSDAEMRELAREEARPTALEAA